MRRLYFNTNNAEDAWRVIQEQGSIIEPHAEEPEISPEYIAAAQAVVTHITLLNQVDQITPEQPVAEISAQVMERPKRKRRAKEVPVFWQEPQVNGEITQLDAFLESRGARVWTDPGVHYLTSPYVKLIPLSYLLHSETLRSVNINRNLYNIEHGLRRFHGIGLEKAKTLINLPSGFGAILFSILTSGRNDELQLNSPDLIQVMKMNYNNYIHYDELLDIANSSLSGGRFDDSQNAMLYKARRIYGRTFNALVSGLSCFMSPQAYGRDYTPQIMAVVLPENYIYQKEYIMAHGKVDLSKVILLVNKELDSTSFPYPTFRKYYRAQLLPLIQKLKMDVWKVPVSFIEDSCFHKGIALESTSLIGIKQEVEEINQVFRANYAEGSSVFEQFGSRYNGGEDESESESGDDDEWNDDDEEDINEEF